MTNWEEFERLLAEAKAHLPKEMNEFSRRAALGALVRGIEKTGGDVSTYRNAMYALNGGKGRLVTAPGKRMPKPCPNGNMWLKGRPVTHWIPPEAP